MSLIDLLKNAQNGQGLGQLASQLGLDEAKATQLTEMLAPAIGSAAKQQAEQGGLSSLLGALKGENQAGLFDDAAAAAAPEGQAQGMDFLKSLLGGQSGADGLATEAASRTGIDISTVQQFLPALAAMAQGGLQKNMPDAALDGLMPQSAQSGGGLMGMITGLLKGKSGGAGGMDISMLTNLLDANGDGSPLDDIMAKFTK